MVDVATGAASGTLGALSVIADPQTQGLLSPPVKALLVALDTGIGAAIVGKPLTELGTAAVANLAGDVAGAAGSAASEALTSTIGAVPFIGQSVKLAVSLVTAGAFSGPDWAQECAHLFSAFRPPSTGSLFAGRRLGAGGHFRAAV